MKVSAAQLVLKMNARSGFVLRSGDFVSVQVLRHLSGNRWAVAVAGKVLAAESGLSLKPGQRLRAVVQAAGGRIVLRLTEGEDNPVRGLLLREGIQADAAAERITAALLRTGLTVRPATVKQLRRVLERLRLPPRRFARVLAILLEKGIDPDSPGVERLVAVLGGEEGGADSESRRRGRRKRESPREVAAALRRQSLRADEGSAGPLPLFNHLRGGEESWMVVPFAMLGGLHGTLRFLWSYAAGAAGKPELRRLVVVVRRPEAEEWTFVLDGARLHAFCDREVPGAGPAYAALREKLGNLGLETDDTIRVGADFDGFSLPWEPVPYRSVDTLR